MIRLSPSVICLAPSDLLEYEGRRQQRELESVKRQFARFETDAQHGPKFGRSHKSESPNELPIQPPSGDGPYYPNFEGADSSGDQSGVSRVASPENITLEVQQSSSPPKDAFHYSGFINSLTQYSTDNTPHRSSPFGKYPPPHNL